ncbi:hypothetical protein BRYFOR_07237 [Marvinbryantia formatexigens DSM 14469]|uniref:Uncharacterized protein n=1 Tax=Marvinbryantia formatexigens DSM 14469 TaxID=478749 RepID=C6LF36_9FIRM|nr:hypothetical protein BRYFOR_07237 [Marvinbryantia formatexigens DSM 14469]
MLKTKKYRKYCIYQYSRRPCQESMRQDLNLRSPLRSGPCETRATGVPHPLRPNACLLSC